MSRTDSSKDKARRGMEGALVELRCRLPLGAQSEPYCQVLRDRGLASTTVADTRTLLRMMFENETAAVWNPDRVTATLEIGTKQWSVATRKLALIRVRQFWGWLLKLDKVHHNRFIGIEIVGQPNRGKPQLRLDEARRFLETAMFLVSRGLRLALAPVIALAMGLRASEICNRVVLDVDDGGRLLWVPFGKTVNSRRTLEVPEPLQPLLDALVADREPNEPLFGTNSAGKPWRRQNLNNLVWEIADLAGVPRVCPHSLRGLWATLAVRSGAACDAVARTLGHSSFRITVRHYAAPEALEGARSDCAASLLFRN